MTFLQIHHYSSQRLLKTSDRTQITILSANIETPSSIIDTQIAVLNTKISKVDQNNLVIAYYCPSCAIPVTPDHKGMIDCSCGLMTTNDKCLNWQGICGSGQWICGDKFTSEFININILLWNSQSRKEVCKVNYNNTGKRTLRQCKSNNFIIRKICRLSDFFVIWLLILSICVH